MQDNKLSREELLAELHELRRRVEELEAENFSLSQQKPTGDDAPPGAGDDHRVYRCRGAPVTAGKSAETAPAVGIRTQKARTSASTRMILKVLFNELRTIRCCNHPTSSTKPAVTRPGNINERIRLCHLDKLCQ